MIMNKVRVKPGICGLISEITVEADDMQVCKVSIVSDCEAIKAMEAELSEVDGFTECFACYSDSEVYKAAAAHCKHIACPVPSGILKAIEVACGLALPKNAEIIMED